MSKTVLLMLFSLFLATTCQRKSTTARSLKELDKLLDKEEEKGLFGSVLLMEKDSLLYYRGMGFADQEAQIASQLSTIYPFGSIVKNFTRLLIFQQLLQERLALEQTLGDFFENVPADKQTITLLQLLQHRAGLAAYHDIEAGKNWPDIPGDLLPMTRTQTLATIFSTPLRFPPGEDYSYSNSGYTLLAMIIEKVSGKSFEEVCQEEIFQPAQLQKTDFYQSPLWAEEEVAVGYGRVSYGTKNSPLYWPRNPMPIFGNGGVAGPLTDLYKCIRYIQKRKDTQAGLKALYEKHREEQEPAESNLIGSAGGNDLGFITVIFGRLQEDQYLVFASNNNEEGMEDIDLLRKILQLGFGFDLADLIPEAFPADGDEIEDTAGPGEGKWGLPGGKKWLSTEAFLNTLEDTDQERLDTFLNQHATNGYREKFPADAHLARFQTWHQSAPFEVETLMVENEEVTIGLMGANGKTLTFVLSLTSGSRPLITAIRLK